jgi:type IV secretory pathway TrbD component
MAQQQQGLIAGYAAVIHQALWKRVLSAGVPRMWFILEIIISIFLTFLVFSVFRSWLALVPFGLAGVTHVALIALIRWDPDFDAVLLYSLRYKSRYHAG